MTESVYVAFAPGQLLGTFRKVEDAYDATVVFLNTLPNEGEHEFTFITFEQVQQHLAQGKHAVQVADLGALPDYEAYDHVYLAVSPIR